MLSTCTKEPAGTHAHTQQQQAEEENEENNVYIIILRKKKKNTKRGGSISFFVQITEIPYSWYASCSVSIVPGEENNGMYKDDNSRTKE